MSILYTNADCLTNKLQELKVRISLYATKPQIISITEVKHKHKWNYNLSELNIEGYNMFTNDFNQDTRGIITYVSNVINCKQIQFHKGFKEYLLLELRTDNLSKLTVGTIYRSPNSTTENDEKLLDAIECFSKSHRDNMLLLGDFNWPDKLAILDYYQSK